MPPLAFRWRMIQRVHQSKKSHISTKSRQPLSQDPDFIKVGCHPSKYVTDAMNTKAEQADIHALQGDLDSALLRINVSSHA
jgi:hypothetical protein